MLEAGKFYSLEEVAELLGVTYQLIYKLVRTGELAALRVGKMYRVTGEDLQIYLANSRVNGKAQGGLPQPIICSVCGRSYVSQLSISGECEVCGLPICRSCVELKKARRCEVHELEAEKGKA
ncbi:MAG: helix-turn-helix domain-containing protein [Victivallales bacterium]|nr:helix-turn-helix domain-containing protein [Victivallales bacterium]